MAEEKNLKIVQDEAVEEQSYVEEEKVTDEEVSSKKKVPNEDTGKVFEYGDLTVACSVCKHKQVIQKAIKGGIQLPALYTVEKGHLTIACENCKNSMSLYFTETAEEDIPKETENNETNDVQEESKA